MQKIMKALRIKGIIPLSIVVAILIALSFSTVFIAHTAKSIISEIREDRVEDAAHSLSNSIFVQLQRAGKDMLITASIPQVLQGLNLAKAEYNTFEGSYKSPSITRPSLHALLNNIRLTFGYYDAFCLLDNNGNIIAGYQGKNNFFVQKQHTEWLRKTLRSNTFTVGNPVSLSPVSNEFIMPISLKVLYNGQIGAVAGTIQITKIINAVLNDSSQKGIRNLVLTNEGDVISTREDLHELKTFKNKDWFQDLRREISGTINVEINGEKRILGFYRIPQANMFAITLADQNYMVSSSKAIRNIAALSDIACALIAILAVIFYIIPIVRDINKLHSFVDKVSKGEPVGGAEISRQDELGVLAEKVDTMVDTLTGMVGKAEASSKAKSELIARMSPEIRTPMNGILGSAYLAMKGKPGEPQLEHLKRIDDSAKDLLGIINDILDFSMLEAEEVDFSMQSFHLNGILTTVSDILLSKAEEKGISFTFSVDKNVPVVLRSDALRITQICINLCSNAIKFTEKGSVFLHVSKIENAPPAGMSASHYFPDMPKNHFEIPYIIAENTTKKTAEIPQDAFFLAFTVSDSGMGVSEEGQATLFDSFPHNGEYTTRKNEGVGLGLSICKSLVHALSGKIGYASIPKKGSIFTFIIPATEGNAQETGIQIHQQEEDSKIPTAKILLAEDNKINQEIAIEILGTMGVTPVIANNGQEAFDLWMEKDFDLILMDIEMPIMDGLQATKKIRGSGKRNANYVPIIAMTANVLASDRAKSKVAGMDDHVIKPLNIGLLRKTLSYWARKSIEEKEKSRGIE